MFTMLFSLICSNLLYFALHVEGHGSFPKPLSPKREQECFERMAAGDEAARTELIEHNLRLVAHIIKKYYASSNDQDDLISIGSIGLVKAVNTFNYEKGTRFATYASRCIENEILMYFRNLKKTAGDVYINDPIDTDKDGNALTLLDIFAEDDSIIDDLDLKFKTQQLHEYIRDVLSPREQRIILLRYGIGG
ncbi:MAG: sigma-70 family RNA polymerase sigma factor, partial [Oscillospiraceae bacterium]|nr:sigma-70 family RNA polymerase sigma factor [Oscillospiraceae bacterium]